MWEEGRILIEMYLQTNSNEKLINENGYAMLAKMGSQSNFTSANYIYNILSNYKMMHDSEQWQIILNSNIYKKNGDNSRSPMQNSSY